MQCLSRKWTHYCYFNWNSFQLWLVLFSCGAGFHKFYWLHLSWRSTAWKSCYSIVVYIPEANTLCFISIWIQCEFGFNQCVLVQCWTFSQLAIFFRTWGWHRFRQFTKVPSPLHAFLRSDVWNTDCILYAWINFDIGKMGD